MSRNFLVNLINQQFYPEPYCSLVDTAPSVCYEESILELWSKVRNLTQLRKYSNFHLFQNGDLDKEAIFSLTQDDIINTINNKNMSGVFLREKNFTNLLGEIEYNSTGNHNLGLTVHLLFL